MREECRANSSPEWSRNCLNCFGTLASRVRTVFVFFYTETWKFGGMPNAVMHNELAPGQHEILPIFALMAWLGKARKARRPSSRVFFWKHFLCDSNRTTGSEFPKPADHEIPLVVLVVLPNGGVLHGQFPEE